MPTDSPIEPILATASLLGRAAALHHAVARTVDLVVQTGNTQRIREVTHLLDLMTRDLLKLPGPAPAGHTVES